MDPSVIIGIIAGVFGAACISILIYGVVTHEKRKAAKQEELERGFLKNLKLLRDWPPLSLIVSEDLIQVEGRILDAVKEAARWWEEKTGKRYFVDPGELLSGHVVPIMTAPDSADGHDPDHAYAYVLPWVDKEGYLVGASVRLLPGWEDVSDEVMANAMKHELGHLLGLAHDQYHTSVMFERVSARMRFVSDHDRKLLWETYDV